MSRRIPALCLAALLTLLSGCAAKTPQKRSVTYYEYFDTAATVIGYEDDQAAFEDACALVEGILRDTHRLCDIYHSYPGLNNLRTVNDNAGAAPVAVEPLLLEVLDYARQEYAETEGLCNVAMGAVLSLWHDCRETALNGGAAQLPEPAALEAAAAHCDIAQVQIDPAAGTVYLADAAMSLDLGAVAKGWATERAARALAEAGFTGYALSVGGNVRVVGTKPGGAAWVSGIQDPNNASESVFLRRVSITDEALVTSGSYQRFFTVDGVRYHHIISPRTLYPNDQLLSVSILTADSGRADALSTAVFNMTPEEGLAFIDALPGVEACWILADGSLRYSAGFEARLAD